MSDVNSRKEERMRIISETVRAEDVHLRIIPDPRQPRINKDDINELARNIKEVGQQEPIHVDANYIIVDGERRWLAIQEIGYPLDIRHHLDIETLDQRDELRDVLEGQKREHNYVDRAYNWARRVIDINLEVTGKEKKSYIPTQLKEIRDGEYDHLKDLLDAPTGGVGGTTPSGYSKLARQLSERTGRPHSHTNVREHCRMIFLPEDLLQKIRLYAIDTLNFVEPKDRRGLEVSYGLYAARLYQHPETMKNLIDEISDPEKGLDSVGKFRDRVQEYQKTIEDEEIKKADEIRAEELKKARQREEERAAKAEEERKEIEDRKEKRSKPDIDKRETDKGAEGKAKQPTETEKALLDAFGKGNSLEGKIRLAKEDKIGDNLIREWELAVERLKPLLFEDPKQVISECKKYIDTINKIRGNKTAKENIEKKIREASDLGLDTSDYRQRLVELIENKTIKENVKQFLADIEAAIVAPKNTLEAEKEIIKAEKESIDGVKLKEFRSKLEQLTKTKDIGRPEVLKEFTDEIQREIALKRAGEDVLKATFDEGRVAGGENAINNPEETEAILLHNATEGLVENERLLLKGKAQQQHWSPKSVKSLVLVLSRMDSIVRNTILDENYEIGYKTIIRLAKVSGIEKQLEILEYLRDYTVDGQRAEKVIQRVLNGEEVGPRTPTGREEPLGLDEVYANNIERTFYNVLKWGIETMRVLGKERWNDYLGYIRGIRIICTYLEQLNPNIPDEKQPSVPALPDIKLDMEKAKLVEAEYEVIK
jgi:hypothetical protein